MLRTILSSLASRSARCIRSNAPIYQHAKLPAMPQSSAFCTLPRRRETPSCGSSLLTPPLSNNLLEVVPPSAEQVRTVVKFSWKKGKRKSVRTVLKRFYRLNCGNWIRTIAGRYKKVWRKSSKRRRRNLQHVFCNATQCTLLDKMVGKYWRKPTYFINSPYEPYEWRNEFKFTRRKPWRPEGCDYE